MKEIGSMSRLADAMRAQLEAVPASVADSARLFAGKTIAQWRATITKAQIGLANLQNLPMATPAQVTSGSDQGYASVLDVRTHADARLANFFGEADDCFFLNEPGFSNFGAGRFYEQLAFVTTQAELDTMLNVEEKMADVFNSWKKISRGNWRLAGADLAALGYSDNAIQSDLDAFTYDPATDKIKNPADTASFVGFISPFGFDNYVLDVVLRSDSTWQNDPLGLIVGYVVDPDGTTHTLSVMRNPWPCYAGATEAVTVFVDYNTAGAIKTKGSNTGLLWVDGMPATGPMNPPPPQPYGVKPWAQAPNGCRLRITRAGDLFTVETTQYDGTALVDAAKFTFTLNDHAALARFKGPQRYGYGAISQDNAIWDVIQRPGARQAIVDLRDKSVREWNGSAWVVSVDGWERFVKPNRFYHNTTTKRLFYAENETTVIPVL